MVTPRFPRPAGPGYYISALLGLQLTAAAVSPRQDINRRPCCMVLRTRAATHLPVHSYWFHGPAV